LLEGEGFGKSIYSDRFDTRQGRFLPIIPSNLKTDQNEPRIEPIYEENGNLHVAGLFTIFYKNQPFEYGHPRKR
jgi:hypothetical protein